MRRRDYLLLAGGVMAVPGAAQAQTTPKMLRVGTANVQPRTAPQWMAFERRMAELGYVEGKNFTYDHVQVPNAQAWDTLCREMVARKPDIIVAAGPEQSLKSARAAAGSLPIVMVAVDYDPIARGHVASLAQPGGNVTGVYFQSTELAAKHMQLAKEAVPDVVSVAVLHDQASAEYFAALQSAAPRFGLRVVAVDLREWPYDYKRAIAGLAPQDRKVLIAQGSPFFFLDRAPLAEIAIQNRMALIGLLRETVVAGGLMSYGPKITEMFALAAEYVDRIAKGAKPAGLSIRQPTNFSLCLNLKTASAIGLTIPPLVLSQADEVIE